jgi:Fur family ferric uptake transcriptional regulator
MTEEKLRKNTQDKFRIFLKRFNHRITPERFEVLDYTLKFSGHFGADELFVEMKNNNSSVSRATVYNTLELLAKCNLLVKRNFGSNKTQYEKNFGTNSHDHLICSNCGIIIEFYSATIPKLIDETCKKYGMKYSEHSFNIFGLCKKCKASLH